VGVRDPDSLDFYAGPAEWRQHAIDQWTPLDAIRRDARAFAGEVRADPARAHLAPELDALASRIDLLTGQRWSFDEESRRLFGVDVGSRDPAEFARARADVDQLLPSGGSLARRFAAFESRFLIPSDRIQAVIARAVDGCREVTRRHLALPANEHVTVEYVRGTPWSAFTTYQGHAQSRTQVNLDFALTVDRALDLACHETYPGHHAINSLTEPIVQAMFSPRSLRTEGASTFAATLAFPGDERVAFERTVLFPLAGLDAASVERYLQVERAVDRLRWLQADVARRYLDGELEFVRAATALEQDALMPSPETTLKFFNEFRTYAVTYTIGYDSAARFVASKSDPVQKWRAYAAWIRP